MFEADTQPFNRARVGTVPFPHHLGAGQPATFNRYSGQDAAGHNNRKSGDRDRRSGGCEPRVMKVEASR